jgi:multidrug transporter EmrE-like cation transporter
VTSLHHLYIIMTILLTVYGQLVFKWQIDKAGPFPQGIPQITGYLLKLLIQPWIITCYLAALIASLLWIAALRHFELSYAYPYMSLTFGLVLLFSIILFQETASLPKIIGTILIIIGVIIGSQG